MVLLKSKMAEPMDLCFTSVPISRGLETSRNQERTEVKARRLSAYVMMKILLFSLRKALGYKPMGLPLGNTDVTVTSLTSSSLADVT